MSVISKKRGLVVLCLFSILVCGIASAGIQQSSAQYMNKKQWKVNNILSPRWKRVVFISDPASSSIYINNVGGGSATVSIETPSHEILRGSCNSILSVGEDCNFPLSNKMKKGYYSVEITFVKGSYGNFAWGFVFF